MLHDFAVWYPIRINFFSLDCPWKNTTAFLLPETCSSGLAEFVVLPVNCSILKGIQILGKNYWAALNTTSVVAFELHAEDRN